jgi:hypothetical protein
VRLPRRRRCDPGGAQPKALRRRLSVPRTTRARDQRADRHQHHAETIKRGWDWLGISPNAPERIGGLIEVPALAASLTLNKGDFIRTGQRGAAYLAFRKAIQEAVARQLSAWGDNREQPETVRPRAMRAVERDLERVLLELSEGFPLLASLVEHRRGGQKRLPLVPQTGARNGLGLGPELSPTAPADENTADAAAVAASPDAPGEKTISPPSESELPAGGASLPRPRGERRPIKLGLAVQFEDRPGDLEPGRLVESTVFINRAHPAYQRAAASRSEGYHIALSVALALAPLAVQSAEEHAFVTTFLSRWGEAVSGRTPSRRRKS